MSISSLDLYQLTKFETKQIKQINMPDTILEEDHPMTIPSKFGSNWATGSRQDGFYVNFP
jgi:hypothetical protein